MCSGRQGPDANPYIFQITLPNNVPITQAEDMLMDVNLTHWGFHRALTHKELMIADPIYQVEQNTCVQELPSRIDLAKLDLHPRESHPSTSTGDVQECMVSNMTLNCALRFLVFTRNRIGLRRLSCTICNGIFFGFPPLRLSRLGNVYVHVCIKAHMFDIPTQYSDKFIPDYYSCLLNSI